jgi:hypothetical protein
MRATHRASAVRMAAGIALALALVLAWQPAAKAEEMMIVKPLAKKLVPLGYTDRAESAADGRTVYQNDHNPPPNYFFLFGTVAPRLSDWGEHITLAPNTPAPLGITSLEFSVANSATSTFVPRLKIWDVYNTAASPVNSGLLYQQDTNYGTLPSAGASNFYRGILLPLQDNVGNPTPLLLSDPDVFIEYIYASTAGGPPRTRTATASSRSARRTPVTGAC